MPRPTFTAFLILLALAPRAHAKVQPIDVLQEKLHPKKKDLKLAKLGQAYESLRAGKTAEARKLVRGILIDPRFSDYGYWITSSADLEEGRVALSKGKHQQALTLAQHSFFSRLKIIESYPFSPFMKSVQRDLAAAELLTGQSYCNLKNWRFCRTYFENAFQRLTTASELGILRPEHLKAYGLACGKEETEACTAWLQKFSSYYSKVSPELKALASAAPAVLELSKPRTSTPRSTRTYKAPDLDQAAIDTALAAYLEERYGAAVTAFRQFLDDYPKSSYRFRAQYWLAQALNHEQKHKDAQGLYENLEEESPLTYYGLLASTATGKDLSSMIEATVPTAADTDPYLTALENYRIRRAESLIAAGASLLAANELREIRARDTLSSPFLLYLALLDHEAGNHSGAFSILGELIQREYDGVFSSFVLRLIFPTEHMNLVEAAAREFQLDPILLLSLIKQESAFDVSAVSSTGAQGLMQIMPGTALDMAPEVYRSELTLAKTNIQTGAKYLAKLMNRFNGNIVLALAGYNAGPNAVDRWVKASPTKRGMLEFIESIPYKETREYVAAIIRNHFWYSRKLNPDKMKSLGYFWNIYGPPEKPAELKKADKPEAEDDEAD